MNIKIITDLPLGVEFDRLTNTLITRYDVCSKFRLEIETTVDDTTGKILKNTQEIDVIPTCITEK